MLVLCLLCLFRFHLLLRKHKHKRNHKKESTFCACACACDYACVKAALAMKYELLCLRFCSLLSRPKSFALRILVRRARRIFFPFSPGADCFALRILLFRARRKFFRLREESARRLALVLASLVKTSFYGHPIAALQSFIPPGFPERSLFSTVLVFGQSKLQPQRKDLSLQS